MDLNRKIELHEGDKFITLPLINLMRLTFVELIPLFEEYKHTFPDKDIQHFYDWFLRDKLKVEQGAAILK